MTSFTAGEIAYLTTQPLGRLATQAPGGMLQVSPVSFRYDADEDCIDIGGFHMADTRKFANVAANGRVAFVVDDVVSSRPWVVRCLEIRGTAEALRGHISPLPGGDDAVIRIRPRRIISYGISDPDGAPDGTNRTRTV